MPDKRANNQAQTNPSNKANITAIKIMLLRLSKIAITLGVKYKPNTVPIAH